MLPTIHHDVAPQNPKSKTGALVLLMIILVVATGGGMYYWQKLEAKKLATTAEEKVRNEMQNKITEAENKINDLNNKLSNTETKLTELENAQVNAALCTAAPTPTEAGYVIYPIDAKYSSLGHLGELFTASDCNNPERLNKIFGVKNANYTLGANLTLNNKPSSELQSILTQINFKCQTKNTTPSDCTQWTLSDAVKVEDILKLKSFYQEFQTYDCVNCG